MRRRQSLRHALLRSWRRTNPVTRLIIGAALVGLVWFLGLTPWRIAGIDLPWPILLLAAAVGWGRVGLFMRPVFVLIGLSLLYDISAAAPLGSYMIVALSAYGVQVLAQSALDMDNGAVMETAIPFLGLATGIAVLWVLASASAGYLMRILPFMTTGLATALAYILLAPMFNLRARSGHRAVGA